MSLSSHILQKLSNTKKQTKNILCHRVLIATAYLTQVKNRQLYMLKPPHCQNFSYIRIFQCI